MRQLRVALCLIVAAGLSACATTSDDRTTETDPSAPTRTIIAKPVPVAPPAPDIPAPPPAPTEPPPQPMIEAPVAEPGDDPFAVLDGWAEADHDAALSAFRRSCVAMLKADPDDFLNHNLPQYGTYRDWFESCRASRLATDARTFFEKLFQPVLLSAADSETGLLTGYYEPEVEVRVEPDDIFSEPILARPEFDSVRLLPRARLGPDSSRVIAYGRPIDVFFLQIQGSGRLRYGDGRVLRAAFAGHNGHPYRSIGRVLIERGELSRNQSAKRNIEAWMVEAGPEQTRVLMNENPRYIFFTEQAIEPGEGPRGAMQVPLTAMGSMAVDPRYHPYGTLAWLQTRLPQEARDYEGTETGLLVVAQDTGSAIRGPLRGDLFFGSGFDAGALAGVMKHPVRWTLLLPRTLEPAERMSAGRPAPVPSLKPDATT